MKKAIGKYTGVKSITRAEAIAMVPVVFSAKWHRIVAETIRLRTKQDRLQANWNRLWSEADRLDAERDEYVNKLSGYSPDWRVINFIAADLRRAVYSYVYCTTRNRKELWIYDGETCPDANGIKKRGQVVWADE
jgi:hypothetical protein